MLVVLGTWSNTETYLPEGEACSWPLGWHHMLQSVFSGACRGSPHVARAERRRHCLSDGLPVLVGVACQQVGAAQELQQRRTLFRDSFTSYC